MNCPNASKAGLDLTEGRKKRKFDDSDSQTIEKFNDYMAKLKEANGDAFGDAIKQQMADDARKSVEMEAKQAQRLGDIIKLDPGNSDRVASFAARAFGQKDDIVKQLLTGERDFTVPGEIRSAMLEAKRHAINALSEVGLWEQTGRIDSLLDNIKEAMGNSSVSKEHLGEIYQQLVEVGRSQQDLAMYGNTPGMQTFSSWRYNEFQDYMKSVGIKPELVNDLVDQATQVASAYDEMRTVVMSQGVDVPKLQGMGFLNRAPTPDFAKFIQAEADPKILQQINSGSLSLSGAFAKARSTYWYVPVHEELAAMILGTTAEHLNDMLHDPVRLRNFLHENVTTAQLDMLVDTGMFNKIPMTGAEAFRYVVDQHQLPFQSINQVWKIDPYEAMASAVDTYKKAVGNAAVIKTAMKDGLEAGWAVPRSLATDEHANWVSSRGMDLDKYGIKIDGTPLGEDLLVHPEVVNQMQGLVHVASSPTALGVIADYINGAFNQMHKVARTTLAVPALGKIFLQDALGLINTGANPTALLPSFYDMFRLGDRGLEAFDNTKVLGTFDGVSMTEQSALRKLLLARGEDIAPESSGISTGRIDWSTFNPLNTKRAMTNLLAYANAYGQDPLGKILKGLDYASYLGNQLINGAYAGVAVPMRMADMGARWAFVQHMLINGGDTKWEDVLRTMDNHFYMYDDPGAVGKGIARYLMPFSSWTLHNLPASVRYMLREPQKFIAANRLWQTLSTQPGNSNPNQIEANFNSDYLNRYPISVGYNPVTKQQFSVMTSAYDPLIDAFSNITSTGNALDRIAFGHYNGTTHEQTVLATKGRIGSAQDFFAGLVGRSYFAPIATALGVNTNSDTMVRTDPGFDSHTFLGKPVSGAVKAVLMSVPPLRALENSGLAGTPESKYYQYQQQLPAWAKVVNVFGGSVEAVDTMSNLNYNYREMKAAKAEMLATIRNYSLSHAGTTTSQMSDNDQKQYAHYVDAYLQITMDLARLDHYKAVNNISTPDLQKELDNKVIKAKAEQGLLPLPGSDILTKALKEAGVTH